MYISQMGFHFTFGGKHGARSILYTDVYMKFYSFLQKFTLLKCVCFTDISRPSSQKVKEQVILLPPGGGVWQHNRAVKHRSKDYVVLHSI